MIAVLAATAVYLLVLGSTSPWDAALGLLAAVVLAGLLRGRLPGPAGPAGTLLAVPALAGAVLLDIARGTWDVALRVVHLRSFDSPGVVAVPFGDRSPRGVAVTGLFAGLSPGTLLLEVDQARRVMLFHVVDATDPDAVRAQIEDFYQRHQRRVFP